jgi:hypothetical protein
MSFYLTELSMNIIKSAIFVFVLINFQSIAIDSAQNKLSQEAEKVRTFLNSINNINEDEKINIIEYFNKPNVGEPVCIKNSPQIHENPVKKILQYCEMVLFGHSLQKWTMAYYVEKLRQKNCYNREKKEYPNHKIDKHGTAIAATMRNNVKIPLDVDIPILTRDFFSQDIELWSDISRRSIYTDTNTMDYCIEMNSSLNKQFPNTIPFRLAHKYACLEKGSWKPYKNLLGIKIFCSIVMLVVYHFVQGYKLKSPQKKIIAYGGAGILTGMMFATSSMNYLQQKEQKARDLRAVELAGPHVELKDFFSLEPELVNISSGSNWAVKELKIKKLEKPSEFNNRQGSSPAQRLRYCEEYAKRLYFSEAKK